MEIKAAKYQELKDKSAVRPVKITDKTFSMVINRFDPHTGAAIDPAREDVNLDELKAARQTAADHLAGLDAMIADLEAL